MTAPKPILTGEVIIDVPFHDVDSMGIVWHGHYVKYLEIARTAMMREVDLDFQQMKDWGVMWPIVGCTMKFIRPLLYGQKVRVRAELQEYLNRIRITYLLTDAETGAKINKAETIQMAVVHDTGELLFECPPQLTEAIQKGLK
jgi:acyl-CoA thioester hydrolase